VSAGIVMYTREELREEDFFLDCTVFLLSDACFRSAKYLDFQLDT
jgi:hypothetical protein